MLMQDAEFVVSVPAQGNHRIILTTINHHVELSRQRKVVGKALRELARFCVRMDWHSVRRGSSPWMRQPGNSSQIRPWIVSVFIAVLLLVVPSIPATRAAIAEPSLLTSDVNDLKGLTFDHIIVGGGLAGMVMASRLSEDLDKRVLLIEAGNDTRSDPLIRTVRLDNQERQVRWQSEPQRGGIQPLHSFGIGLGGSTSINGAKVDGPPSSQIDAIREFGNPSWSWTETLGYMKKSQNYRRPGQVAKAHGATYDPDGHGTGGPVQISFSPQSYTGFPQETFVNALNASLGIDKIVDAGAGEAIGFSFCPHFIKHGTNVTRESSATAYYDPIQYERGNLFVLTGWRGIRVNWDEEGEDGLRKGQRQSKNRLAASLSSTFSSWPTPWQRPFFSGSTGKGQGMPVDAQNETSVALRALGVRVQSTPFGPTFDVPLSEHPDAEVTLSSGALVTPLLLELSGVGDREILDRIGVETKIDLPGVGRNLVDKPTNILSASTRGLHRQGGVTGDPLPAVAMLSAEKVYEGNVTEKEAYLRRHMFEWAKEIVAKGGAVNVEGLMKQFEVTLHGVFHQNWPVAEWEYFSRNLIAIKTFVLQPWSRGYVHSRTNNSVWNIDGDDVKLNARVFTQQIDLDTQVASLRAAKKFMQTNEMRSLWHEELLPLPSAARTSVDPSTEFVRWQEYILQSYDLICHNFGTAAMMQRSLGGVVNEEFKVYGTDNVRVVDASIFPLQLSAHPSLTIFGVAEKAADLVRGRRLVSV